MSVELCLAYDHMEDILALFQEYTQSLGIDLSFQNYTQEVNSLPGKYALPGGRLYMARYDGMAAGCIALRPHGETGCEMKRLYVRPVYRKHKIGRLLVDTIIADAREIGYTHMLLDTLPSMESAIGLYKKLGFYEVEPYRYNPVEGTHYLRLDL